MTRHFRTSQLALGFALAASVTVGCAHRAGPPTHSNVSNGDTGSTISYEDTPSVEVTDGGAFAGQLGPNRDPNVVASSARPLNADAVIAPPDGGVAQWGSADATGSVDLVNRGASASVGIGNHAPTASTVGDDSVETGNSNSPTVNSSSKDMVATGSAETVNNSGVDNSPKDEVGTREPTDYAPPTSAAILQRLRAYDAGEILIAKMAVRHGGREVKAYGNKVLRNRRAAEKQIAIVAKGLRIDLVNGIDQQASRELDEDQETLQQLGQTQGAEFDRLYTSHMQQDRQNAVNVITNLRAQCSEKRVCSLIDRLLPSIQREANEAKSLPGGEPSASNP